MALRLYSRRIVRSVFWPRKCVRGLCVTLVARNPFGPDYINYSPHPDVVIPEVSFPEFIIPSLIKWRDKVLTIDGSDVAHLNQNNYTGARYLDEINNFAFSLQTLGLKKGDVLGLMCPNIPEFIVTLLGNQLCGGITSPMSVTFTPYEANLQIADSGAKFIVTSSALYPVIKEAISANRSVQKVIVIGDPVPDTLNFKDLVSVKKGHFPAVEVDTRQDVCLLPYSSGTSGLPKGVMLTHHNIVTNMCQYTAPGFSSLKEATDDFQERIVMIIPMYHIYGFMVAMFTLRKGSAVTLLPKFVPENFFKILSDIKPTKLYLVPPVVQMLTITPDVNKLYLEQTHTIISGGAPLGAVTKAAFKKNVGRDIAISEGYGLTETSPLVCKSYNGVSKEGSINVCIPNTLLKIVHQETGETLGPNIKGELAVKGPQVMKGYWKNQKATEEVIDSEGWFKTGDVAYFDDDGFFFIVDRMKELIKVKGLQVAPAELENVIREHPMVMDVGVTSVEDDKAGELPRAYVVKKDPNLTEEMVQQFVESKVARHKHLKGGVVFVESIPKVPSGKILRRILKEMARKPTP